MGFTMNTAIYLSTSEIFLENTTHAGDGKLRRGRCGKSTNKYTIIHRWLQRPFKNKRGSLWDFFKRCGWVGKKWVGKRTRPWKFSVYGKTLAGINVLVLFLLLPNQRNNSCLQTTDGDTQASKCGETVHEISKPRAQPWRQLQLCFPGTSAHLYFSVTRTKVHFINLLN